jgi:DNA primase
MDQQGDSSTHFLEEAAAAYQENLASSPEGLAYLAGRGLSENAVRTARLGLCSTPLPGHEPFTNMISIPYVTPTGVRALKFRQMGDALPKYNAPMGQRTRLYNVMALQDASDMIAVCEGEFDTIVLHHMVGVPAIGVSGANNWKPHFPRMLRGFQTVLVVSDNDAKKDGSNPGQDLAARVLGEIQGARNVLLPPGMDVNEFYLSEGRDAVLRRLGLATD